jgi:general secretion pathway protein D
MNMNRSIGTSGRRFLAVFLSLCLTLLPGAALADGKDGNGKKNYKEGLKYEQSQQWDMAAQKFALALSAEPNNPEYKVHYLQSLSRASLMYITRGDALADQNDYQGAYVAYRQAYNYDPGNEISKFKMERMLELQKTQASGSSEKVNYNTKTGAMSPVGNTIQVANNVRPRGELATDIKFSSIPFKQAVKSLADSDALKLNVVFDDSIRNDPVTIDLKDVTVAKALDIILMQKKYAFEEVDRRTIFIYPDNTNNRPRFEKLLIQTFYLNNISAQTVKNVLAQMLPAGRQSATVDSIGGPGGAGGGSSNVLIVKATPAELQLVKDLIANIDKNKNEVVLDIEIYEVSNDSLTQIGNQFVTSPVQATRSILDANNNVVGTTTIQSPSLGAIGGIGLSGLQGIQGGTSIGGNLFSPFLGGVGTLIGFPPSQISLLQSRGKSKLLHKTQIHVLDGGENETKVGRRVPVSLGSQFFGGGINVGLGNNTGVNGANGVAGGIANGLLNGLNGLNGISPYGSGFNSIQYQDVGLVIKAKPQITNEGYVEIKMNFESSDIQASAGTDAQNLTPTFTQRSLNTVARIQDGVTAVVAGVNQDSKGDSRTGLPVFGMLPLVGRLFATPKQTSAQTDIIITVTPHIVRSAGITKDDYLAHVGPPQTGGMNQSIEDVINRAHVAEEEEQRMVAEQQGGGAPLDATSGVGSQAAQPANYNSQPRQGLTQPANYNGQQNSGAGLPQTIQPASNTNGLNNRGPVGASPAVPIAQGRNNGMTDLSSSRPAATDTAAASPRPENVDLAVARLMAEEKARKSAGGVENASSTVNFNLSPKPIKERVGKSFTVTVDVSGGQQMSGADIALKYDASQLQVKSVRDGGLFGQQPDFSYDKKQKGMLTISVKHPYDAPTATKGRLVMVEFSAIGEGQSEIALSSDQTRAKVGAAQIPVAGSAIQVTIGGRDSAASSVEK